MLGHSSKRPSRQRVIRVVKRELLDSLSEDDPNAMHNRRDIRKFNVIMGNFRWFRRTLKKVLRPSDRILEIGAGSGDLGSYLLHSHISDNNILLDGLDLCSRPQSWRPPWGWHKIDLRLFEGYDKFSIVLASMILHQFEREDLFELGRKLSQETRVIIASETARRRLHLYQLKLGKILGTNPVTDHDARVSIEAGFLGDELPRFLGLESKVWSWSCQTGILGQYRMTAVRKEA